MNWYQYSQTHPQNMFMTRMVLPFDIALANELLNHISEEIIPSNTVVLSSRIWHSKSTIMCYFTATAEVFT